MSRRRWNTKATPRNGASQRNDSGLTLIEVIVAMAMARQIPKRRSRTTFAWDSSSRPPRSMYAVRTHGRDRASGFALIEVMVALVLIGVVATAVLAFFTGAMRATSHLQRTQSAYAVAAEAMEKVRSISAVELPGGTSGILMGRAKLDVLARWAAAATIDTAGSTAVWDLTVPLTVTTSVSPAVPLVVPDLVRSGIHYTVTTLIGECYLLADQSCTVPQTGTAVRVFRVTVVVGWKPTSAGACSGAALCVFRMSSLVDPNPESNWNLIPKPVANDDNISAVTGGPLTGYEILANDVIGAVTSNPVNKQTDPAFGTAAVITSGTAMGMLNYTPPPAASGIYSLTYWLRDAAGRTSEPGTVNISVYPKAVNDSASVRVNESVDIDVAANDLGTFGTPRGRDVAIVSGPSVGSASVVNGKIKYLAPTSGTSDSLTSLTYTITDASLPTGLTSTAATVSITLVAPLPPTAVDLAFTFKASATAVPTPLNMFAQTGMTGNDPANKIVVVSGPTGGASPGTLVGTGSPALSYTPAANTIGVYTFTYKVQNVVGVSAIKTVTLTVWGATDDTASLRRSGNKNTRTTTVDLSSNDVLPVAGMTYELVGTPSGTACGTATVVASTGMLTFTAPLNSGECTVPYTVSKTVGSTTLSATANLVVTVTNQ
jgi:prepilin-type N-terminal cleavage/methylation domain-containing protein